MGDQVLLLVLGFASSSQAWSAASLGTCSSAARGVTGRSAALCIRTKCRLSRAQRVVKPLGQAAPLVNDAEGAPGFTVLHAGSEGRILGSLEISVDDGRYAFCCAIT